MPLEKIRVSRIFSASPGRIYEAWLSSVEHSKFTGAQAEIEPRVGGRHTAWDGYIEGEILELVSGSRIVKTWHAQDFPEGAAPSHVEVQLLPADGGTEVVVLHTKLPAGHGQRFVSGWEDFYFKPMSEYFNKPAAKKAPAKKPAAKKAPAKKAAATKKPAAKKAPAKRR